MERYDWETDVYGHRGSCRALILLAVLLSCVFFLAIGAYGYYTAMGEGSLTGELPDAVLALRNWVEGNEAVAVLLGLPADEAIETAGKAEESTDYIREAADAYIKEKQGT